MKKFRLCLSLIMSFLSVSVSISIAQLTENFEINNVPPPGWTFERTGSNGTQLWSRFNSTGGYGLSNHCAKFSFYSAYPQGITQSLVTPMFAAITPGGYIRFDHAYASRFDNNYTAVDTLRIETSTDGGITFDTLVKIEGGEFGPLTTAPPIPGTEIFIPTLEQWATKNYLLPVGTNKIRLRAVSDFGNNLYIDNFRISNIFPDDIEAISIDLDHVPPPGNMIPKATFKNSGTLTHSFTVTMKIIPGNYISTVNVINLAPAESIQVSFSQWNFTAGPYQIKAYSELSSDNDRSNDTLSRQYIPGLLWQRKVSATSLNFTADGMYLISGGSTGDCYPHTCGQIKFWRVADSTLLETITNSPDGFIGLTNDIAVSPDNQRVYSAHGNVSQNKPGQFIWDFPTGDFILGLPDTLNGNIFSIDISPDGELIATGRGFNNLGEIRIYSATDFSLIRVLPGHNLHTYRVRFSLDGGILASVGYDGKLKLWDVNTGMLIRTLDHGSYTEGGIPLDVSFSTDGQFIASSGYGYDLKVKVWRISDGELIHNLNGEVESSGYPGFNRKVLFSPNGQYIATTVRYLSGNSDKGLIRFWNLSNGEVEHEFEDENTGGGSINSRALIHSFAFSNTGNLFAYSVGNMLKVTMSDLNLVGQLTGISQNSTEPLSYNLYQNYPNPFNPETNIQYSIPKASEVSIIIYDVLGKEVTKLVNKVNMNAGIHEVKFNASHYSSGIFFYKLKAGEISIVKKMMVLK